MALTAYQIQQRKDALKPFVKTYGLKFLNKLAKEKANVESIYEVPGIQLENLKTRLKKPEVENFILATKRYPTESEARSLGHEFGEGRIAMRSVKESLVADLKGGRVDNITPQSLAAKYGVTVEELKIQAKALEKNIWNKRMGVPETELKWLVDEGNNLDNTLNNLYKGKIVFHQKDKVRELFYSAFGDPKNKGTPLYQPEKWKSIRKNLNTYFRIKQAVIKKYPNLNFELDHPLAKSTLRKYLEAKPQDLVRVNPMTQQLNRGFKKALDERYGAAIKEKNIVKLNAIDKIAKDLNVSFGKVNQDFKTFDYGPASKSFENLNMGEEIGKALTQQQDLSKNFGKYTKANSARFLEAGFSENSYKKLVEKGVPDVGLKQESFKRLILQLAKTNENNICDLVAMKAANGGRIGFAKGGNCATQVAEQFDENPVKFTQEVNKKVGIAEKVKNAGTRFLNVAKKGGRFGAFAAAGAAAAGLVKEFRNDDPSTYLSNENQQKNMLIDMITQPVSAPGLEEKTTAFGDAQLPAIGAVTVAGMVPGGAELYRQRTGSGVRKGPLGGPRLDADKLPIPKNRVSPFRAALGPLSGVLGKGLAATGTPLGMLALEPLYIGQQIADGDSAGEIATNPLNYLGPAFAGSLSKEATRFAGPKMANFMRLGISPMALKTVSRRFGLPGLGISAGISGYEMYQNKKAGRGLFDDG
jgi:hypothetical protein